MASPPDRSIVALVREVSPRLADCVLTHLGRSAIDIDAAVRQHGAYCDRLADLGARIERIEPLPVAPDGVFVEDTAVVLDEVAVITRPGADSRLCETASVARALARYRALVPLADPARLDGGDVLAVGRILYVGRSGRTNAAGIAALSQAVAPFDYDVCPVAVDGCLHLKTACTFVPPCYLVANPQWVDPSQLQGLELVPVADDEPFAANTLTLGGVTLVGLGYPRTADRLAALGVVTHAIDVSELAKAEGALTCSSVLVPGSRRLGGAS